MGGMGSKTTKLLLLDSLLQEIVLDQPLACLATGIKTLHGDATQEAWAAWGLHTWACLSRMLGVGACFSRVSLCSSRAWGWQNVGGGGMLQQGIPLQQQGMGS